MLNPVPETFLAQFANSPVLTALVEYANAQLDPSANINAFYADIFDINTAFGYGLDVWGRILGVSRVLEVASGSYFGFAEAGDTSETPFNQAPFYSGLPPTGNFPLADAAYRTMLFAKALANITNCSIPGINQILMTLFPGQGNCYVTDGNDMTMTYTFSFFLSAVDYAIVFSSGIIPKPAGVSFTIVQT